MNHNSSVHVKKPYWREISLIYYDVWGGGAAGFRMFTIQKRPKKKKIKNYFTF